MEHQLVVRGGTVIDGTGRPAVEADIGIDDGVITEIAPGLRGTRMLEASGHVVTPGFIDLHTHYDPQVLWDPALRPSSQLGVTSVIAGNCGFSIAPCPPDLRPSLLRTLEGVEDMRVATLEAGIDWDFETYPEYLQAVARRGPHINFGGYVGHTPIRLAVLGDEAHEREATPAEVDAMCQLVQASMRGGALGFSSDRSPFHRGDGGRPVPSAVATQAELEALWHAVDQLGHGLIHVAPGEDYSWIYDVALTLDRPVTWSAILAYDPDARSKAPWGDKLTRHQQGREAGADVRPQVSCRPITFQVSMADPSSLYSLPSFAAVMAGSQADRAALYRDPAWRQQARDEIESGRHLDLRWDQILVAEVHDRAVAGRSLAEVARERGCHPFEVLLDVALAEDLTPRFLVSFANHDPVAVTALLQAPGCVLGLSDAGAHMGQICDAVMPLDYLATWVRDRQVTTPEDGIRRLTGELADLVGLDHGRGYLAVGAPADLAVLGWDALGTGPTTRVVDFPGQGERLTAEAPTGLRHLVVNGTPIRVDDEPVALAVGPGQLLTNAGTAPPR